MADRYKNIKNRFRREKSNSFAVKTTDDLNSPMVKLIAEKKESQNLRENLKQAVMMGKNLNEHNLRLQDENEKFQTEIKICRSRLETVRQQLSETIIINDKLEETFREQRDQNNFRKLEVDDLKKRNQSLKAVEMNYERLLERNKKLRIQLKRVSDEVNIVEKSNSMVVMDELEEAVSATTKETKVKRQKLKELENQIVSLEEQVKFYKREKEEERERNATLIKRLRVSFKEELETKMEEYESALRNKEDEIQTTRSSLAKLKQTLVYESEEKRKEILGERNLFKEVLERERRKLLEGFFKLEGDVQQRLSVLNGRVLHLTVHGVNPLVSREEHQNRLKESREARIRLLIQHREQKIRDLETIAHRLDEEMLFLKKKISSELDTEKKYQDEIMANTYEREIQKVQKDSSRIVESLKTRVCKDIQDQIVRVKGVQKQLGEVREIQNSSLIQHKGKVHELEKVISAHNVVLEEKESELSTITRSFSSVRTVLREIASLRSLADLYEMELRAQGVRNKELEKLVEKGQILVVSQKKNLNESMLKNRNLKRIAEKTKQLNHRASSNVAELESKMCRKENEIEMLTEKNKRLHLNALELRNENISNVRMIEKLKSDIKSSKIRILKNVIDKQRVQMYRLQQVHKRAELNLKGVKLEDLRLFKFLTKINEDRLSRLRSNEERCEFMEGNLLKQVRVLKGVIQRQKEEIDELKDEVKEKVKVKQHKLSEFKKRKKIRKCQNVIKLQNIQIRKLQSKKKHKKKLSLDGDNSVLIDVTDDQANSDDSDSDEQRHSDQRDLLLSPSEENIISPGSPKGSPKGSILEL